MHIRSVRAENRTKNRPKVCSQASKSWKIDQVEQTIVKKVWYLLSEILHGTRYRPCLSRRYLGWMLLGYMYLTIWTQAGKLLFFWFFSDFFCQVGPHPTKLQKKFMSIYHEKLSLIFNFFLTKYLEIKVNIICNWKPGNLFFVWYINS